MHIPLHNRSAYSFGSALTMPEDLVAFAVDHGIPAIALTDLNGLYAAVDFYQTCRKADIKPIVGTELVLIDGTSVTLLAQNLGGYGNICRLVSLHHLREQPLDHVDLCERADDVICLIGRTARSFRDNAFLREAFPDRLYIELTIHNAGDVPAARQRASVADELDIPVVATCESRCLRPDQSLALRALASIGTLTLLDRPGPDKPEGTWHLRTPAEMARLFRRRPDAIANTLAVAQQCELDLDLTCSRFPAFTSPDGRSATAHLRELCVAGCHRRYVEQPQQRGIGGKRPALAEALQRLDRELAVIDQVHYAEYFLVFHEINQYCRSQGIATLARGSAADSLVCYALGVSHACPFRFDLPFDRFLNPERAKFSKMADIDLDLPWDQRDQVVRWVYDRWGHDHVAMIGSANTFHGRAAVAELGKAFGLPAHEVHQVTKRLPRTAAWNLTTSIAHSPEAHDLPVEDEPYRTILQLAGALEGLPRHWSMHPCGLVVSPEPLTDLVPVQRSPKGPLVAQYDMGTIEDLGFIKIDLLGQAGLSVLRDTVSELCRTDGIRVDLENDVDYSDADTWEMIATGGARGVHHIESPAMTSLLGQCNCRDIDCLTTVVAIIRPGAANQGKKNAFARRYQGGERARYAHPSLKPVLAGTYGLMVFEEHILQTAVEFAGMNLGRADVLRRALNKEDRAMVREMQAEFYAEARRRGRSDREIDVVWSQVEGFSGFMFNKAHSAEYAVEAFQGAWLKRRWPAHYLAAVLSNYRGFYMCSPTLPQILYVLEALHLGIGFLPPCVNRSQRRFSVEEILNPSHDREGAVGQNQRLTLTAPSRSRLGKASGTLNMYTTGGPPLLTGGPPPLEVGARFAGPTSGIRISNRAPTSEDVGHPERLMCQLHNTTHHPMIRVPVTHIQGLSQVFLERYLSERETGPFTSLIDFVQRCRPGESEAQTLLDSGALDGFGIPRPVMFWQLRRTPRRLAVNNQTLWDTKTITTYQAPPIRLTHPDELQIARQEKDLLGFPITIDPLTLLGLDEKGESIDWSRYVPVARLGEHLRRRVSVCGLMVADRVSLTRGGDLMKFVTLADRTGFVEAFLFPNAYSRFGYLIGSNPILAATGIVEPFENRNGHTLQVESVSPPARLLTKRVCEVEPPSEPRP